jgi:pyrimidine deaminase RibD-like protein
MARLTYDPNQERRRKERFQTALTKARNHGFSEREAPLVAAAVMTRGQTTLGTLRAHLRATYPWLYTPSGGKG